MSTDMLPSGPQDLNPAWLTAALGADGVLRDQRITALTWEIIGQDWGLTGVVAHLWLQFEDHLGDVPHSIVAKFPMALHGRPSLYQQRHNWDESSRQRAYQRAAREVLFYHYLAGPGHAPAPRQYYGAADPEDRHIVLLLQDLASGVVGDVISGCSASQADAVLQSMAPFHAHFWEARGLQAVDWLPRWGLNLPAGADRFARAIEPFLAHFGSRLPSGADHLIHSLARSYVPLLSELRTGHLTLIHGDLHLDNVIFTSAGEVTSAWVIDWQGVMKGSPALDLAFIALSLSIEDRRLRERSLLEAYHGRLVAHGVVGYEFPQLERAYVLALLATLAGTVMWLGLADMKGVEGRQRAMIEAVVDEPRLVVAALDHWGRLSIGSQ